MDLFHGKFVAVPWQSHLYLCFKREVCSLTEAQKVNLKAGEPIPPLSLPNFFACL